MESSASSFRITSSSNMDTSSPDADVVFGGPAIANQEHNGSDSRSSSIRSVKGSIGKKRDPPNPSSALARVGSRNRAPSQPASSRPVGNGNGSSQREGEQTVHYQQLNQTYVDQGMNAEVIHSAATAVLESRQRETEVLTEAQRFVSSVEAQASSMVHEARSQAANVVASTQAQAAGAVASSQVQAAQLVAQSQVSAAQSMLEREAALKATFDDERNQLLTQIRQLSQRLADVGQPGVTPVSNQNVADFGSRLDMVIARLDSMESQILDRFRALETDLAALWEHALQWDDNPVPPHDEEEELVPEVRVQTPSPTRFGQNPFHGFGNPAEEEPVELCNLEEGCISWKEASSIKLPSLPDSAGSLRQWKNSLIPQLVALDKSSEGHLFNWLMKAFSAISDHDVRALQTSSDGFPKMDRMLCSWLTKGEALKGYFGPRIQSFLERSLTNQIPLRGRPILNIIVREFDLERSLGGMISSVELFQISSPEGDPTSLLAFRDKIQYILGQLPDAEKPPDPMLSRWMFERLKKVRAMSMVMDRIRESPAGSPERTFDYLWSRLNRHLAELQHDKNLTSIQESLRKGPKTKTLGTPATSTDKGGKSKGKGKGDKGKSDNSKGKSKGKGSTSGGGSKPNNPGEPSKGESQGKGKGGTQESGGSKRPCVFFPKGLCRRGKDCPYSHDQPKPKPAAAAAKPKAAMVALVGALSCQPTAAIAREVYQVVGS